VNDHQLELLFRAAQSRSRGALNQLLEYCRDLLGGWARWSQPFPLQDSDAEDRVQETLLAVVRCLDRCQWRGPELFRGWLRRLLFRQISDWRRGQTRDRRDVRRETPLSMDNADNPSAPTATQVPGPLPTPVEELIWREMVQRVMKAVEQLPRNQQQVILLHYLEGLPLDAVADKLKLAYGTVRNLHSRALRTLK
jgi:RNA polymerase sigma factor (sigma-70 family)